MIVDAGAEPPAVPASEAGGSDHLLHRIAVGGKHVCILPSSSDETLCFGDNQWGQLANGTFNNPGVPLTYDWSTVRESVVGAPVGRPLLGASSLMSGDFFSCASRGNEVLCWGYGLILETDASRAIVVAAQSYPFEDVVHGRVIQMASGLDHACILAEKGVFCSGSNSYSQVNPEISFNAFGITAVPVVSAARRLTLGTHFSLALFDSGEVRCWGANDAGQCGTLPTVPCASNPALPCVVEPAVVPGIGPSRVVVAGEAHACAIGASDGKVRCWGNNHYGQLGIPDCYPYAKICPHDPVVVEGVDGAEQLALGADHSCALSHGQVQCWGSGRSTGAPLVPRHRGSDWVHAAASSGRSASPG